MEGRAWGRSLSLAHLGRVLQLPHFPLEGRLAPAVEEEGDVRELLRLCGVVLREPEYEWTRGQSPLRESAGERHCVRPSFDTVSLSPLDDEPGGKMVGMPRSANCAESFVIEMVMPSPGLPRVIAISGEPAPRDGTAGLPLDCRVEERLHRDAPAGHRASWRVTANLVGMRVGGRGDKRVSASAYQRNRVCRCRQACQRACPILATACRQAR